MPVVQRLHHVQRVSSMHGPAVLQTLCIFFTITIWVRAHQALKLVVVSHIPMPVSLSSLLCPLCRRGRHRTVQKLSDSDFGFLSQEPHGSVFGVVASATATEGPPAPWDATGIVPNVCCMTYSRPENS